MTTESRTINEDYASFMEDVLREADFSGAPQHECFFEMFSGLASENGDTVDLDYTPALKEGNGGYQVDGYALDIDRGELFLAICDYHSDPVEPQKLNANRMEALFRRADAFCKKAIEPDFINSLEETSPAFSAAYPIYENHKRIKRIRIILLTNAELAVRRKAVEAGEVIGKPVAYNVLDFSRYVDIENSHGQPEPIEIDIKELNGKPLPCLPAHVSGSDYSSYLIVLPGALLSQIYGLYGARLLEQNVRVFLQARTKVNQGIINTVRDSPEMFFAYNNGLTATASDVVLETTEDGNTGISAVRNLQIVNGGQTTASILYAQDQRQAELGSVFVQMKLSVIKPEKVEEIVPKISRFANTQNRISEADFFSSHPFHVQMEKISRRLSAPATKSLAGTKWFYERARGQYKDAGAYGSAADKRRFQAEFPKNQVINKTDLAKYEASFECYPHLVSQGAQKCFLNFAERVAARWEKKESSFHDGYFREAMARAIVFRQTDKIVSSSDWYKADRGYKANIVTYTIAWLVNHLREDRKMALNLTDVWNRQELPPEIEAAVSLIAEEVAAEIKNTPDTARNVSEYAKQIQCWAKVKALKIKVSDSLYGWAIGVDEAEQQQRDDDKAGRIDVELEFEQRLLGLQPKIAELREVARSKGLLSPNNKKAIEKLERGQFNFTRSEKNAMRNLLERLEDKGYSLS